MEKEYKIIIDQQVVDEYNAAYFKLHPRARKKPIEYTHHPLLNTWMILPRIQMNAVKQRWKDFGMYIIKKNGYENLQLDKFEMTFITYMNSRRRVDPDGTTPKFLLDAFTESQFIIDDSGKHLKSLTLITSYDKENPRTEIYVKVLEDGFD